MTQTTRSVRSSSGVDGPAEARPKGAEDGTAVPEPGEPSDPLYLDVSVGLFHLRRTWAKPVLHRVRLSSTGGRPLQLSNLMVVYAVAGVASAPDAASALPATEAGPGEDTPGERAGESATDEKGAGPGGVGEADRDEPPAAEVGEGGAPALGEPTAGEVTVGDVADRLEIDPSTASRLVGHAISAGLISRRPSPLDARRASLRLTEAGARVMEVADRYRHRYLATLMADWTGDERREFARLLTRFTEAAARHPMQLEGVGKIFEEAGADETPGRPQ